MSATSLLACSTCQITMREAGGEAASWSIFTLLVIILLVMGSVGWFMVVLARREKANLDPSLSDEPVSSSSH